MTRAEILALKPGQELDAAILAVFGFASPEINSVSQDAASCDEFLRWLRVRPKPMFVFMLDYGLMIGYRVWFKGAGVVNQINTVEGDLLQAAVCKAALLSQVTE
jgi:hypothetical protein